MRGQRQLTMFLFCSTMPLSKSRGSDVPHSEHRSNARFTPKAVVERKRSGAAHARERTPNRSDLFDDLPTPGRGLANAAARAGFLPQIQPDTRPACSKSVARYALFPVRLRG